MKKIAGLFAHSASGNFAPTAALVLMPILLGVGIAVDYSNLYRHKSQYQDALDAAVLAGAREREGAKAKKTALKVFEAHAPGVGTPKVVFRKNGDGNSVTASFSTVVENAFLGIVRKPTSIVSVKSQAIAPKTLSAVKFEFDYAKGDYDKTVSLMAKTKSGQGFEEKVNVEYTSPLYSTGIERVEPKGWVTIDDFDGAYIQFGIDPESHHFRRNCSHCATEIKSTDPEWSHRIFQDGVQFEKGLSIDVFDLVECGKKSFIEWEDGGTKKPDIGFWIEGRCESVSGSMVRLAK